MTSRPINSILLIEDNAGDARLLREMLKPEDAQNIHLTHVVSMSAAEQRLAQETFDVILLDLRLPDVWGLEAVRRARVAAPRMPLVVLTGSNDGKLAAQTLHEGAQDYLIKGEIETRGLLRALRYAIEREHSEARLEESNELLGATLRAVPYAIVCLDRQQRVQIWNRAAEENFGYSEHELLGSSYPLVPEEGCVEFEALHARVFAGETLRDIRLQHRRKDGELRKISYAAAPIHDGPRIRSIVASLEDVTDRALADITLRQSEHELQTLARELGEERERLVTAQTVAKIGSWETTLETLKAVWSEEMYRIFELDPAQFRPTHATFLAFVHPEDRATVENAFQDSMSTRDVRTVDHRILMFDGRVKFVTETWQTFMDDKGRPARAVGTCQDITEREVVNDLLRSSEARLRRSQEISSVAERVASIGSVALDFHTSRWEWSDQAYRIYGVMRETFTPSPETLGELVHPEDVEILLASISLAREGTTLPPLEYRIRRPDGAERVLRREATLVRGSENTVIGIVGTVQDVTDIRAAERERDLLQTQLRQSQRLEAIGQMTGGVAHDFNNLLTVILGNAEAFERHLAKDTPLHELAQMTRMAAERGAELTSRLLAFSRRQPLAPKAADINSLVFGMDKLLCRALGQQISITTICGDGLWRALIDTSQLESALLNLSVNARDAMPEGGSLTIETKNVHLDQTYVVDQAHGAPGNPNIVPGQYVMIAVTDTGIGMNEETRLQAFDPFFTTKDVGKGSGLGLSMVYGFVRQSKGHVRIYSERGHGTTIKLYLPRTDDDADASEVPIVEISPPGGTESILLVEDDDLVRSQVTMQLKDLGYQVTSAIDGVEALDILRTTSDFHLLFTDIVMPRGLNGRELADEARKLRPELPVLFTSGYADNALVHQGRVDSGVNLLSKPYRRLDLATKIRALLDHAGDKVV